MDLKPVQELVETLKKVNVQEMTVNVSEFVKEGSCVLLLSPNDAKALEASVKPEAK
jgi:hypothetical protein